MFTHKPHYFILRHTFMNWMYFHIFHFTETFHSISNLILFFYLFSFAYIVFYYAGSISVCSSYEMAVINWRMNFITKRASRSYIEWMKLWFGIVFKWNILNAVFSYFRVLECFWTLTSFSLQHILYKVKRCLTEDPLYQSSSPRASKRKKVKDSFDYNKVYSYQST